MIVDELRIVGSSQTNVVMAAELVRVAQRALKRRPPEPRKEGLGQLVLPFDRELAWAATTYMRTPTRVVWDVYRSRAQRLEPLYDELVADIRGDARTLWRDGDGISVEARHVEEFAAGERQVVGTVKNALLDAARARGARLHVDPERPTTRWVARLDDQGELVVSIDLGGGSLSQRGWRREAGAAPLREHLAAVLLMLGRFDPRKDILVDPMCGSGTIPIEAVLAARATPRPTPTLSALGLAPAEPAQPLFADAQPIVIGCDLDLEVLAAARDNARAARVTDALTLQRADIANLRPEMIADIVRERGREPGTGLILSNPPYGERLDEQDLGAMYETLAHACKRFRGWRAGFLVASPIFEDVFFDVIGRPRIKKPLANANLRAYFFLFDL
ncbi:MAG: putative methylase [Deltaproteobacteria bacterium]|nr:putative methylase [Deltaproteobacteria bacterium]